MGNVKAKKFAVLGVIMAAILIVCIVATNSVNSKDEPSQKEEQLTIVTSFYPMYIATQNVVDGMENVKVVNLMAQQQGCLHDYQLTTDNMRTLENADVLIINGAGMEAFIDDVRKNYKDLTIIDSSEGIDLLTNEGEEHTHEEEHSHEDEHTSEEDHAHEDEHTHDHGEYNAHIWLDPIRYEKQVQNIADGLVKVYESGKDQIEANAAVYKKKVEEVNTELTSLKNFEYSDIILFHNSMEYITSKLDLHVAYCLNVDAESSLSAGKVAAVIEQIKEHDIKVLFSEVQFENSVADRIAEETGAKVYTFDSLVTGDTEKDAYIEGMRKNIKLFKEALYK